MDQAVKNNQSEEERAGQSIEIRDKVKAAALVAPVGKDDMKEE